MKTQAVPALSRSKRTDFSPLRHQLLWCLTQNNVRTLTTQHCNSRTLTTQHCNSRTLTTQHCNSRTLQPNTAIVRHTKLARCFWISVHLIFKGFVTKTTKNKQTNKNAADIAQKIKNLLHLWSFCLSSVIKSYSDRNSSPTPTQMHTVFIWFIL